MRDTLTATATAPAATPAPTATSASAPAPSAATVADALHPHSIELETLTDLPRRSTLSVVTTIAGAVLVTALVVAALLFQLSGGRWFIVKTPSMGTAAPVGTFILSTPTTVDRLHVGDIVTFHPPTTPNETYTHRIIATGDGFVTTRGDINGATDPWRITDHDIVGKVTTVLPGLGWLIRALPILLLGLIVVWLATARMRNPARRTSIRILGSTLLISIAAFILRPFTGVVVLETTAVKGATDATVVSTGLLPIRVQAAGGPHVDLTAGHVAQMRVPLHEGGAPYQMSTSLHLDLAGWIVFGLVCALPLLWVLIVGLPTVGLRPGPAHRAGSVGSQK